MKPLSRRALSFVALSLLILGATSCAVATNTNAPAANGNTSAPAANTNANTASSSAAVADSVTAKEKLLWDALRNKDLAAFGNMMASDAVYVTTDGVHDKASTINGLKNFAPTEVNLSDWKTVVLDEDVALVTYTLNVKGTGDGQPLPPGAMRASTAWVKRGAEWLAVYHQDSPVEEAPAATTSSPAPVAETSKPSSTAAKANANTAGGATTAPAGAAADPIAREKELWDALKRKDWDTFAAGLAEEQIEVEPHKVFDKAGTLEAVRQFDFGDAEMSNLKPVKLTDDVTLVTYTVKGRGPDRKPFEERTSTIWVNRGGKWLAIFHQGTPVQ